MTSTTTETTMARKKAPARPRYADGRAKPERAGPTPEHQAKRIAIVHGGDPVMSSCPLDAALERHLITVDENEVGHELARLYGIVSPSTLRRRSGAGGEIDDGDLEKIEARLRAMTAALLRAGRPAYAAVVDIAVFGAWSRISGSTPKVRRREGAMLAGFKALAALKREGRG